MPARLIAFLLIVLAGLLYITTLNTSPLSVTLYPGLTMSLPLAVILMAAFFIGVVAVMLLYFYDAVANLFSNLKKSSEAKRAERVLRLYESAAERLMMENRREAEKLLKKALAHQPNHAPSLIALGKMRREEGAVSEAIKLHAKARGLEPENIAALFELAEDYIASEQFANAVSILQEALALAGRSLPPLLKIRDVYLRARNWAGALETQRKIVSLAPWDRAEDERRMLAALTYESAMDGMAAGKLDEAKDGLKAVLRGDDQFVPAYLKLAEIYARNDSRRDAVKILEKGFRVSRSIVILMALESLLLSWNEVEKAVGELRWAKNILPDDDVVRLFLAEAYLRHGDYPAARWEIEGINGRLSGMALFHLVEGKASRGENNIDMALDSMDKAFELAAAGFMRFTCSNCGVITSDYAGRCRSCGAWNCMTPSAG